LFQVLSTGIPVKGGAVRNSFLVLSLVVVVRGVAPAFCAGSAEQDWSVTPKIGYSNFTGIFGVEVQRRHWALDVGYFPAGGVRYYFRPQGHSWFAGLYGSGYGYDNDETKDGIAYTHYSRIEGGAGGGYRWRWRGRWNLELGVTAGYVEQRWTSPSAWRTCRGITLSPLATFGVSF
jgi:hypothetical protein